MVTLAQAKVGREDKVYGQVIDTFRRESPLLDQMEFDDCINPSLGGSNLTYGYMRTKTPAVADFRAINTEYTENSAAREKITTELKVFGGKFSVDRVIASTGGKIDEVNYQMEEKIKATKNLFHYTVINGDSSQNTNSFDGLNVALAGSSTEINSGSVIDVSSSALMDSNYKLLLDLLDQFLSELSGRPAFLMGNNKMITKLKGAARRAGYLTQSEDSFGRTVEGYDGVPFLDMGFYTSISSGAAVEVPVVPIASRTISENTVTGLTDLYAVSLGLDKFHGVTVTNGGIISTRLPDFSTAGAVKDGDVEMIAAIALKSTRAAGVLRNIKVA
ncbi:MAG: phage capsid protein [Lachnospiraceae bacterium]|nr:phage capsid protein [Lachnospiraceae bacterium]MBR1567547.1 phage capsid protein [Lachnospiraceae bacterium]MBR1568703.1 phage capsid protein [Lachnospiraceae bacterium]